MSLKKTDLYKNERMRIHEQMRKAAVPGRFGDQGEVLTPFNTRLPKSLIKLLQTQALTRGLPLHELVTQALRAGLGGEVLAAAEAVAALQPPVAAKPAATPKPVAKPAPVAEKTVAKKAAAKKALTPAAKKPAVVVKKAAAKAPANKAAVKKVVAKKVVAKKAAPAQTSRKKAV
jgi:hypothetical protein